MRGVHAGVFGLFLFLTVTTSSPGETAAVPLASGFDLPVGHDHARNYFKARGYQPTGHLGEDWNGAGGGNTDLGDPVHSTAEGLVVFARDYHVGWGNVIIVRHAYQEEGETKFVDSLYGHLDQMLVVEGALVQRGQQIGTIGNNHGMYEAHLHFEMRRNLAIGMNRSAFAGDLSNYFDPTLFVESHRLLEHGGQLAAVPVNTFNQAAPPLPVYAGPVTAPVQAIPASALLHHPVLPAKSASPRGPFVIDRYSDLRAR